MIIFYVFGMILFAFLWFNVAVSTLNCLVYELCSTNKLALPYFVNYETLIMIAIPLLMFFASLAS